MLSPITEVINGTGRRVALSYVSAGTDILSRQKSRFCIGRVAKVGAGSDGLAVTLVTTYGRRLTVGGSQKILVRGKRNRPCWRSAWALAVGSQVYTTADGVLTIDRVSCLVMSDNHREPWVTLSSTTGTVFAEEILCRAA